VDTTAKPPPNRPSRLPTILAAAAISAITVTGRTHYSIRWKQDARQRTTGLDVFSDATGLESEIYTWRLDAPATQTQPAPATGPSDS